MSTFKTKNDVVYNKIKDEIINNNLRPGERIVVADIARRYDVSPMPVREALARLQQDELVEIMPHIGARVTTINRTKFLEIATIRTELETMAARLATPRLSLQNIEELELQLKNMENAMNKNDVSGYEVANHTFHEIVYSMCGNKQLQELIQALWAKTEVSRTIFYRISERIQVSFQEHKKWLDAIKKRDADKVADIVRMHKEKAFERLSKLL